MSDIRERLRSMLEQQSVLEGPIQLRSGQWSPYYFDSRRVTLSAAGAPLVGAAIWAVIETLRRRPAAVGGLTSGADPIVAAVQWTARERGATLESFYVRKQPKDHGTRQWIENAPPAGTTVVIVDDVVTRGGSALLAIERVREAGCQVAGVICLVDRGEGGMDAIRAATDEVHSIFTLADFPRIQALARS
jgi:orotate phosphoribosyltransferase